MRVRQGVRAHLQTLWDLPARPSMTATHGAVMVQESCKKINGGGNLLGDPPFMSN